MSSDGIGLAGTSPTISLIGERESGESTQTSRIDRAVDHGVDCAWAAVAGLMAAIAQMQQEI
ncbi:MAG: hypothetical protein QOD72_70, partial [Acidimicrobiaceae bacterium]|nr:hypothetical protein [Acidimicrobiaceae bacterium]